MIIKSEDLLKIHIPRWEEFPAFELYIDQVIALISEKLEIFNCGSIEPIITASMINNYVKNGVLNAPVKKKYNREHLAKLVVICIGKRMLSISDLSDAIAAMMRVFELAEGYNTFCDELEYEIFSTVDPAGFPPRTVASAPTRDIATIRLLAGAVAKILIFERIVTQRRRLSELTHRMLSQK